MSKSKREDLTDKFYTKKKVAEKLLSTLDLEDYENIIEPSAGNGSFSDHIGGCIAIDIDPQRDYIKECDFLEEFSFEGDRSETLVVGNPPFGRQGSKALEFIKRSAEIADTIAFILPKSFKKDSMKKKVPEVFHLSKEVDLSSQSFVYQDEEYSVPVVFQVWKNKGFSRKSKISESPIGFEYVSKQDTPDLAVRRVGVYAGNAFLDVEDKSSESHYFLRVDDRVDIEELVFRVNDEEFKEASFTSGPNSISKHELNVVINDILTSLGYYSKPQFW